MEGNKATEAIEILPVGDRMCDHKGLCLLASLTEQTFVGSSVVESPSGLDKRHYQRVLGVLTE